LNEYKVQVFVNKKIKSEHLVVMIENISYEYKTPLIYFDKKLNGDDYRKIIPMK
jgi:hypothetical protein